MQQTDANKHPNVKRYIAPVSRQPQVDGIDFERAYKTLMQGYIDAYVRHKLQEADKGNHSHHASISPHNSNLNGRKETTK